MRKKIKFYLVIALVIAVISVCSYVKEGWMKVFILWAAMAMIFVLCCVMYTNLKILCENRDEKYSEELHELFQKNEMVEVSLRIADMEIEKIKEVLEKEQVIQLCFYAKLVGEEIRVTMKIGDKEYPDFLVYQEYSEFAEKFNV